jgi:hypothetical protein
VALILNLNSEPVKIADLLQGAMVVFTLSGDSNPAGHFDRLVGDTQINDAKIIRGFEFWLCRDG